ncbi:MAG: AAA family ATPase [Streptosporangiaceae bacterium]|nr:AAA family ATPase [Streptosporangiaceae bacterium]
MRQGLVGREAELTLLSGLIGEAPRRGNAIVLLGDPGIGKTSLLRAAAARAREAGFTVLETAGVETEALLPYAGLHQLLRPVLSNASGLPAPLRRALLAAFGEDDGASPEPFFIALAALNLLAEISSRRPVLVAADDVQWLDRPSQDALAFLARRVSQDPVVVVAAVRKGHPGPFAASGLDELDVGGLDDSSARDILAVHAAGLSTADQERILGEALGNPLALVELPVAWRAAATPRLDHALGLHLKALPASAAAAMLHARAPGLSDAARARSLAGAAGNALALAELPVANGELGEAAGMPTWLPLTIRLERAFAARTCDLPAATRTALLVAAVNNSQRLSEVLDAAALVVGEKQATDLTPAVTAQLIEIDGSEFRFRHPLMRTAIRQEATISQRQAAHAALAEVLRDQPDRAVWHRAASIIGPDEAVAGELEAAARRARRRGGTAVAVSALQRAADLGHRTHRAGRLLQAAELAFELGRQDLVLDLAAEAEPLGLPSREHARLTWIKESFTDGIPGDAAQARALAAVAGRAAADGDIDLALKLLYGASLRCWWADPGQAVRDQVVATAERLNVSQCDPRLLVVLAFAAPIGRGAVVIDRLPHLTPAARSDPATLRLAGNAAMAVGAFEEAAGLLAAAAAGLRAQGRLGLLARALVLQAWSAVHIADLGAAIPGAEEAFRLAQETRQPLIMATARAVQAILAALRGDYATAEATAAHAEQICVPLRASAVLAATQLARGLACLAAGRPADAVAHLRRIHDPADPAYHYAVRCYTIGDLAEAAARSGHRPGIGAFLQEMEAAARQTPSPSLHGGLQYARALLASGGQADPLFGSALQSGMSAGPFLRARVQLAHGAWLHQHRHDAAARTPLRAAMEVFDALGVIPWSERARQQLRATGEKSHPRIPGARDQLTPQELQIAQLAADGLTNREIGQKLYLSHRTIGSHLYRIFPKLGIASRAELRHVLEHSIPATLSSASRQIQR